MDMFSRFSDLPELSDYREPQLRDALLVIESLKSATGLGPDQLHQLIQNQRVNTTYNAYSNKYNEVRNGNRTLVNSIQRISFTRCASVIGDDDYV